uniref:Protein kinase n=1 Tax=Pithovirus LCPAC401 TaxID=2506595 RepID=A0A481Z9H8_9VIRU|nr:MAG: protein kinase [Pithovirus LCPAC401]
MFQESSPTIMRRRSSDVIKRFNSRTSVVDIISNQSPLCSKIDNSIVLTEKLGSGGYSIVWSAELENKENIVAVKIPYGSLEIINVEFEEKEEILSRFALRNSKFNEQLTIKLNGDNPNRIIKKGDILRVPKFSRRCLTTVDISLETITVPKGTYLCEDTIYSEFLIGLLCSNLARSRSINFINIMDLSMCPESKSKISYMFQERMMNSLEYGLIKIDGSILIQIFHAIACYQENYAISHNDLHTGNILYTKYVGLGETTHLAFVLDDVILYIPKPEYIFKISDFGQSCKYSDFIILNYEVVNNESPVPVPVNYSAFFDLGTIIIALLHRSPISLLLLKCITYIFQDDLGPESEYHNYMSDSNHPLAKYFNIVNQLPFLHTLDESPLSDMSAYKLLRSHVFNKFRNRPIGNVVIVATI